MTNEITIVLIGLFAGIISGITGVGSAVVLLTLLNYFKLIENYTTLKGTILYTLLFPVSILSVYNYYKSGNVNIYVGTILVGSVVLGGFLGSKLILLSKESGDIISKRVSGIILIICGILILMKK